MSIFTLRKAEARDAEQLTECIAAAYAVYASVITDLPPVSEGIAQTIETSRVWVAETEEGIVGGIVLDPHNDFLMLENVAVRPDSSGMGVGAALIRQAEADCLELQFHQLRLSTHVDMPANVRWYEHLGWQVTGRSGNKVLMSKDIQKDSGLKA